MALRERNFCGCEIPFWANKNGHAFREFAIFGKDGFNRARIGLKRSDEVQIAFFQTLNERFWRDGIGNFWKMILTALLAGLECDGAPLFALLGGFADVDLNNRAV